MATALSVFTVRDWGGLLLNNDILQRRRAKGFVIHATASPNRPIGLSSTREKQKAASLARAIQYDHRQRNGWRDTGHHFLVTRGGLVLEGRNGSYAAARQGLVIQGAHAGRSEGNRFYWGIEVEGKYTKALLPQPAWNALVRLCAQLSEWAGKGELEVLGHRQLRATECPGDGLYNALKPLGQAVRLRRMALSASPARAVSPRTDIR